MQSCVINARVHEKTLGLCGHISGALADRDIEDRGPPITADRRDANDAA